ncbi:MAG TPA: dTDP-4-dehydrorhamnose 3,5-epimerase [Defluviicoccus sp.]|nr:dTDP-4-dehydrorhamnose 3,5-epimerase [Defluviicoccus sp.]
MKTETTELDGVLLITPDVYADDRGLLFEAYHAERYRAAGIATVFVQDNVSVSCEGVLRGLHFQNPSLQAKLVSVVEGEIFDVAVDVRQGSPAFRRWTAAVLSAGNHRQIFIPEGFAHGFCVLSGRAVVTYKCSSLYAPGCGLAIAWNDPEIGIVWPVRSPLLSAADRAAPRLADLPPAQLPAWDAPR